MIWDGKRSRINKLRIDMKKIITILITIVLLIACTATLDDADTNRDGIVTPKVPATDDLVQKDRVIVFADAVPCRKSCISFASGL